jgi:hypothetical protein
MARKQTPDLMSELMGSVKTIEKESNKTIKQENNKEKTTFNLSVSTLEKLEESWIKLRKQIKDKGRITKTLIVERAIELAIKELEEAGEASALFRDLSH